MRINFHEIIFSLLFIASIFILNISENETLIHSFELTLGRIHL